MVQNYRKFQATLFLGEWGAGSKSLQLNCRISVYVEGLLPPGKEGEGLGGGGSYANLLCHSK